MTITIPSDTHMNNIEVLPCPFCGKNPVFRRLITGDSNNCYLIIQCNYDESHRMLMEEYFSFGSVSDMTFNTIQAVKKLVERWNKRV